MTRTRPLAGRLAAVRRSVERNQTAAFVALAFAISWGLWLPPLVLLDPATVTKAHLIPGAFGPFVAAALITRLCGRSVRDWLTTTVLPRRSRRWLLAALAVPVALGAGVLAVLLVRTGRLAATLLPQLLALYPVALLVALLVGGGQEEPGWRGFALPRLQARYSALTASLLLGAAWALWHLPLFAFEAGLYSDRPFPLYAPAVVAFSVLLTWQYNGSGGSVPVVALFHAGINTAPNLAVSLVGGEAAFALPFVGVVAAVACVAALAVVLRHGPATLADGPAVTRGATAASGPSDAAPDRDAARV